MDKKQENIKWFDKWSETYDNFLFRRLMWYWQDKTIDQIPVKSKSILEIACGTGIGTEKAAKKFPGARLLATDLSLKMVQIAKKRLKNYKNVTVQIKDVENLRSKSKYDCVFCTEAFHHFPNPEKALLEISRATKKGGIVIITDINVRPLWLSNILFLLEPGFVKMYSCKKWRELFNSAGLKVLKQQRVGLFALLTVGKKN